MGERTYVHATVHDDRGRHKPTSWHIIRAPLAHARTYVTLCGRTIVSDDTMSVLPAAKSCENCLRIAARNEDRA